VLTAWTSFLAACDLVGVRGSAGIETRVYIPEFATREINSPVSLAFLLYGIGFTTGQSPESVLTSWPVCAGARQRNQESPGASTPI